MNTNLNVIFFTIMNFYNYFVMSDFKYIFEKNLKNINKCQDQHSNSSYMLPEVFSLGKYSIFLFINIKNSLLHVLCIKRHILTCLGWLFIYLCMLLEKWNSIQSELSDSEIWHQTFQCILGKTDMIYITWLI